MARLPKTESGARPMAAGQAIIAAIVAVVAGVCYLGAATVARHRAQSSADLAALAAATEHVAGGDGCTAATALAERQDPPATVADCRITDPDVSVTVEVPVHLGAVGLRTASATARAGPAGTG